MKKQALLIIDMLNDFVLEAAPLEVPQARQVLGAIRLRLDAARAQGTDVVFVCDSHDAHDPEFQRMGWPAALRRHGPRGIQSPHDTKHPWQERP